MPPNILHWSMWMFAKSITLTNVILLENDLNFFLSNHGLQILQKYYIGTIPSGSKSWIGKSLTIHESENNPTRGRRLSVGLFSLEWRVMDFPIQLFEPDGNSIPIELMRFYYITTWFFVKSEELINSTLLQNIWNWSIPHFWWKLNKL